ncbi:MAG: hypothetical protein HWN79_15860, partial [Candidatus Lokiarchaeota archaeon]|nr:hypothetical protein [Candidatus Lokiarchaeota archaeon]
MAELFGPSSSKKNPFEDLAIVYVMYFDEAQGHMPLLIYPDDQYRNNKTFMRPIKYHPIWFLTLDESDALDHIDLEFKGLTFFGKKFLTHSKREKRRAGLKEETPETIVVILSLPDKIELFGDELIRLLTQAVQDKYFRLIELAEQYGEDTTQLRFNQETAIADINQKFAKEELQAKQANEQAKIKMAGDALGAIGNFITAFAKEDEEAQRKAFNLNKA